MPASLVARWSIAHWAAPALRRWDDEYVAHHALSNDTHRLSESAGRLLRLLGMNARMDIDQLVQELRIETEEVQDALEALHALGFVEQC